MIEKQKQFVMVAKYGNKKKITNLLANTQFSTFSSESRFGKCDNEFGGLLGFTFLIYPSQVSVCFEVCCPSVNQH